jgi:type IV pilus assembly protein PilQ
MTAVLSVGACTATQSPQTASPADATVNTTATTITRIATESLPHGQQITVEATGALQYTAFKLQDPMRLIVDITAAHLADGLRPITLDDGVISSIEPVVFPDRDIVRLLVHLRDAATHTLDTHEDQLHITLAPGETHAAQTNPVSEQPAAAADSAAAPLRALQAALSEPEPAAPAVTQAPTATTVTEVKFQTYPAASVLIVRTEGAEPNIRVKQRKNPLRLTLDIPNARLQSGRDNATDVHDTDGAVTRLQTQQLTQHGNDKVNIIAHLREKVPFEVLQENDHVRVIFSKPQAAQQPEPVTAPVAEASTTTPADTTAFVPPPGVPTETMLAAQSAPAPAEVASPPLAPQDAASKGSLTIGKKEELRYTGEKISLDFQNADINDILRLIAEVSGLNIIAGPDVKGTVTTRMVDVPWDQALDIILKINGLDQEREENIIRVAPLQRFTNERQERLRAEEAERKVEPLVTQLLPINYADVEQLKANMEKMLSDRGSIFVDSRTNTMIVSDTQKNITDVLELVSTLDRQTPQVMIEVRIVEATRDFTRELGVRFRGRTARVNNANFPNAIAIGGAQNQAPGNFLVDLPAAVGAGSGGAIGVVLSGASSLLDIELSALESSGKAKVVSNPKIATLDNKEAVLTSGVRIPFETVSDEGTQTEFVDASITLRVTPHVTPDGFISMKVNATKNEPNEALRSAAGQPSITTREATTEMLVKDGDTVVIAGLYKRDLSFNENGVPGLSKIPVLGWLFKKQARTDNIEELLIFITPRIIKQPVQPSRAEVLPTTYQPVN